MLYVSSRGRAKPQPFTEILLEGLAPDGGLFLPGNFRNSISPIFPRCAA
jgi:threonine synthase